MTVLDLQLALQDMPPNMEVVVVQEPTNSELFKLDFSLSVDTFTPGDSEEELCGIMIEPTFPNLSDN